jgi:hypothetical protein
VHRLTPTTYNSTQKSLCSTGRLQSSTFVGVWSFCVCGAILLILQLITAVLLVLIQILYYRLTTYYGILREKLGAVELNATLLRTIAACTGIVLWAICLKLQYIIVDLHTTLYSWEPVYLTVYCIVVVPMMFLTVQSWLNYGVPLTKFWMIEISMLCACTFFRTKGGVPQNMFWILQTAKFCFCMDVSVRHGIMSGMFWRTEYDTFILSTFVYFMCYIYSHVDLYEMHPVCFRMCCMPVFAFMLFPLADWLINCIPSPTFWMLATVTLIPYMVAYSNFCIPRKIFWITNIAALVLCRAVCSSDDLQLWMCCIAEVEILLLCTIAFLETFVKF